MFSLLTLNISHTFSNASIVDFEQVIDNWVDTVWTGIPKVPRHVLGHLKKEVRNEVDLLHTGN